MTNPSPYEAARDIADNIGGAFKNVKETSNLEEILSQAYESQGEEGYNNAMKQILTKVSPQNQKMGIAFLQSQREELKNRRQQKVYESLGANIEGASPESPFMRQVGSILKSNLPADEKNNLIKNIGAGVTLRTQQQARLERDSLARRLRDKVKSIDADLGKARLADRPRLLAEKKILDDQLDELYNLGDTLDDLPAGGGSASGKIKFDPMNEAHQKIFIELEKKHKGKKDKIIEELKNTYDID